MSEYMEFEYPEEFLPPVLGNVVTKEHRLTFLASHLQTFTINMAKTAKNKLKINSISVSFLSGRDAVALKHSVFTECFSQKSADEPPSSPPQNVGSLKRI